MHIVFPGYRYNEALKAANLSQLDERRLEVCQEVFAKISEPDSRLHHLLPPIREQCVTTKLRNSSNFSLQNAAQTGIKNISFRQWHICYVITTVYL